MLIFGQNETNDSVEWKVSVPSLGLSLVDASPVKGKKPKRDVLDLKRKKENLQTIGLGIDA